MKEKKAIGKSDFVTEQLLEYRTVIIIHIELVCQKGKKGVGFVLLCVKTPEPLVFIVVVVSCLEAESVLVYFQYPI